MHTPPPNILQFHKLQPLDALNSDRWRLSDPMSGSYSSVPDQASIHLWPFESVSPLNATKFMVLGWGTDRNRVPVIQAWGVNDLDKAMAYIGKMVQQAMGLPDGDQFHYDKSRSCPWIRFVEDALVADASGASLFEAPEATPKQRTVETMLKQVKEYGAVFDQTMARAVAMRSCPEASADHLRTYTAMCLSMGTACRDMELEAVYWSSVLWEGALDGAEIFLDSNVPPSYIPDGPQLWYFEEPVHMLFEGDNPCKSWWTPDWTAGCIALLPIRTGDADMCVPIYILEKEPSACKSSDDRLPRIAVRPFGVAGKPCPMGFAPCMAGIEFMATTVQKAPHEYTRHEQKMAHQRSRKLQPYSIAELRHYELPEHHEDPNNTDVPDGDDHKSRNYHFSFFQRRHRRRLKVPRKSDGVQVIRVAAGQKCKHLPLLPGAKQMVTKVSR